jgi:hypothetical protein
MERHLMSNENPTTDVLRSLVTELDRRRSRIAKVQRSMAVTLGAYDLTIADLRAAYGESDPAGESTA